MSAINPYDLRPVAKAMRRNANMEAAQANPGYGAPAPNNTRGPDTSGDKWEGFFKNTNRIAAAPPATPKEQQGFARAAQNRAIMARRSAPTRQRIQPFTPAPVPKEMQVAGASMKQKTPFGEVGVSYVRPGAPKALANRGRIMDETGDRTAEFSEQNRQARTKRPINPLATTNRRPRTI